MRFLLIISAFFLNVLLLRAQEVTDSIIVSSTESEEIVNMINNPVLLKNLQPLRLKMTDYFNEPDFLKEEIFKKDFYENGLKTTISMLNKNLRYISPEDRIKLNIKSHDDLFIRGLGIAALYFLGNGYNALKSRLANPHTQLVGGMFPGLFLVPNLGPMPEFNWNVFTENGFDARVYQVENALPQPFNQEFFREQYLLKLSNDHFFSTSKSNLEIKTNQNANRPVSVVLESVPKNIR